MTNPRFFAAKTEEESLSSVGHPSSVGPTSVAPMAPYKRPFAIPSKIRQTVVQNAKIVQRFDSFLLWRLEISSNKISSNGEKSSV